MTGPRPQAATSRGKDMARREAAPGCSSRLTGSSIVAAVKRCASPARALGAPPQNCCHAAPARRHGKPWRLYQHGTLRVPGALFRVNSFPATPLKGCAPSRRRMMAFYPVTGDVPITSISVTKGNLP